MADNKYRGANRVECNAVDKILELIKDANVLLAVIDESKTKRNGSGTKERKGIRRRTNMNSLKIHENV